MDRRVAYAIAGVVIVAVALFVRSYFSPERVMTRALHGAAIAVEEERLLGALQPFFKGYRDECGFDFEFIAGGVHDMIETFDLLTMDVEVDSVEVDGETAQMRLRFALIGTHDGQRGYILGSATQRCRVRLRWEKKAKGWVIVSASDLDVPNLRDEVERMCRGE